MPMPSFFGSIADMALYSGGDSARTTSTANIEIVTAVKFEDPESTNLDCTRGVDVKYKGINTGVGTHVFLELSTGNSHTLQRSEATESYNVFTANDMWHFLISCLT
jgi:hypothetical protein